MTGHKSWTEAIVDIDKATRSATDKQKALAKVAGNIDLLDGLPRLVAAARLQAALSPDLDLHQPGLRHWRFSRPGPCTDPLRALLKDLETDHYKVSSEPQDQREAWAWLTWLRLQRRRDDLESLKLEAGDIVDVHGCPEVVSSIGSDGRIFLKGGGPRPWPDQVKVAFRRDDTSEAAQKSRKAAANTAATRRKRGAWSAAKHQELSEHHVKDSLSEDEIDELERVIDSAGDEKPIQMYLESNPQLLTALLTGNQGRYCIPRQRLGVQYVTDFLLAEATSLGVTWMLVEIETPNSTVTLKTKNELDVRARKGVSQIQEWRDWLTKSIAEAQRPRADAGHGLVDITAQSRGLVVVGRRSMLRENAASVRAPIRDQNNIQVHTYDWLVDALRGTLQYDGIPVSNPFALDTSIPD